MASECVRKRIMRKWNEAEKYAQKNLWSNVRNDKNVVKQTQQMKWENGTEKKKKKLMEGEEGEVEQIADCVE